MSRWVAFALVLMIGCMGCKPQKKKGPSAEEREEKREQEEREELRAELAKVFKSDCNSREVDESCDRFKCFSCKTSAGRVDYQRHATKDEAASIRFRKPQRPRDLGSLHELACGGGTREWFEVTSGPLKGKLVMADDGDDHVVIYTRGFFIDDVESGFSDDLRRCIRREIGR